MQKHSDRRVNSTESKHNFVNGRRCVAKGEQVLPGYGKSVLVIDTPNLHDVYFFTPPPSPSECYEKARWRNVKGLDANA